MLYSPKWELKVVASRAGFIAWLESKNPNEEYDFRDCGGHCLIGQYMDFLGVRWGFGEYYRISVVIGGAHLASSYPRTFGGALARADRVNGRNTESAANHFLLR